MYQMNIGGDANNIRATDMNSVPRSFERKPQTSAAQQNHSNPQPQPSQTQPHPQAPKHDVTQPNQNPSLMFQPHAMFAPPVAPYRNVNGVSPMIAVMGYGQGQVDQTSIFLCVMIPFQRSLPRCRRIRVAIPKVPCITHLKGWSRRSLYLLIAMVCRCWYV